MLEQRMTPARVDPPPSSPFPVTALAPSASLAVAIGTHWREYLNGSDGACFFDAQYMSRWRLAVPHRFSVELSRTFAWINVVPYGNGDSCDDAPDHSFTVRSSVGSSFQPGGNARVSVAKTSTPLGTLCYVVAHFVGVALGVAVARNPRRAFVFRSCAIPCHYSWNIRETRGVYC
jgi:hypothetical protein